MKKWGWCVAGTLSGLTMGVLTGAGVNTHVLGLGLFGCTILGGIAGAVGSAAAFCRQ
jgi:hypothetical protein